MWTVLLKFFAFCCRCLLIRWNKINNQWPYSLNETYFFSFCKVNQIIINKVFFFIVVKKKLIVINYLFENYLCAKQICCNDVINKIYRVKLTKKKKTAMIYESYYYIVILSHIIIIIIYYSLFFSLIFYSI